jgi:hypothetical protein
VARPIFGGRRAVSRIGQLLAFGAVVLLVSGSLAALGGAVVPALDAGSRLLIAQSGPTAAAARLEARLSEDPAAQDAGVRDVVADALGAVAVDIERSVMGTAEAQIDGEIVPVLLVADPGIGEAATLSDGTWPAAPGETAIQDAAAAALHLSPGDELSLDDVTLTISGTWRADDPAAPRWSGDPAIASGREGVSVGPLLVDENVIAQHADVATTRWTLLPHPASLDVAQLTATGEAFDRVATAFRRLGGGNEAVTLRGELSDSIARATRATATASGILAIPFVLIGLAGAIVLLLIARALAAGRAGEFLLLRARGASVPALAGEAAREAGAVALLGALLGGTVAVGALWLWLPSAGTSGAAWRDAAPLAAAVAVGVVVVATSLATIATISQVRAPVAERAEAGRGALLASLGPLAIALVAAALSLAQFLSLGSPVRVRPDGQVRTDALAVAAPVLVLVAAALIAPVVVGPVVAVAERVARAGRGILPVLPLRQLSRRARSVSAGILVVAIASGAVGLAAVFQLQAEDARIADERAATGADLRIAFGGAGLPASAMEGIPGVDGALAVLSATASLGGDPTPLVAAHLGSLAGLPGAPAGLAAAEQAPSAVALPAGTEGLAFSVTASPGAGAGAGAGEGASVRVTAWFSDADGAAWRQDAGTVPVNGVATELTLAAPADATGLLAIEMLAPKLPDGAVVSVALDRVRTDSGEELPFTGDTSAVLGDAELARLFPAPAGGDDTLPVAVGADLADRLQVSPGSTFSFRLSPIASAIPARVAGVLTSIPGQSGSLGIVVDLPALESFALGAGGAVPATNQLWVRSPDPELAAEEVRARLTERARIVTPVTLSPAPVLTPTGAMFDLGVAVTLVLAVLGFAAVAASTGRARRAELAPLRSLGLSAGRIRRARAIELAVSAVLAMALGSAAGLLTALLVVPGLVGVLS